MGTLRRRDALACTDFLEWFDDADAIRSSIAKLIHCSPGDIAFIPNAATALGLLMSGVSWEAGDQVIALEHEFPNNLYWPSLLKASGVEFLEVPWNRLYESLTERTRLVLVSAVNYSTGFRVPAEELGEVLRQRGILYYLDGTQSVGALKVDVASCTARHACRPRLQMAYVAERRRLRLRQALFTRAVAAERDRLAQP